MYDYDTLVGLKSVEGSIRSWGNHASIPATQVLWDAQNKIYATLRTREMRVTERITLAEGDDALTLPARFLDPISLTLDEEGDELDYVHENLLKRTRDSDGEFFEGPPSAFTILDEEIQFDTKLDQDYEGDLVFYQQPVMLSSANATNFLTDRFSMLLRHACTAYAYEARNRFTERDQMMVLLDAEIKEANRVADMARRGQILR